MNTNIFYEDGLVKVTRSMFEAGSTQFPIRNIGSVRTLTEEPNRKNPIICICVGVLLIAASGLGLLLIAAGIYWWTTQKTLYYIIVVSGGSESRAYSSTDSITIRKIQSAINQALELH